MKKTTTTKSSNNRIVKLLMILGLGVLMMSGCSQVNDMVNGNKATNTNTATNSNASANTNANSNTMANSNATANTNANSSNSNKPADNTAKTEEEIPEIPSDEKLQAMAKEFMLAFNDSVQKEDFTDFRNKVSKWYQNQSSAEKMKSNFSVFYAQKADLQKITDSLKTLDAEFSKKPFIQKLQGLNALTLQGRYQSSPRPAKFTMYFIPEEKEWKLAGITVDTKN